MQQILGLVRPATCRQPNRGLSELGKNCLWIVPITTKKLYVATYSYIKLSADQTQQFQVMKIFWEYAN